MGGTTQDWELPVCEIVVVVANEFCEAEGTRQRATRRTEYPALFGNLGVMDLTANFI